MHQLTEYKYNGASFLIFWGDARNAFCKSKSISIASAIVKNAFDDNNNKVNPFFTYQIHENKGVVIDSCSDANHIAQTTADFLITNQLNTALSIITADCTPLILIDTQSHAIGIVHAGWRGTALFSVIETAIETMQRTYQTKSKDLYAFFGPSAQVCCYEIKEDVVDQLLLHPITKSAIDTIIIHQNNTIFFDLVRLQKQILINNGLQSENINLKNALCTICNLAYCSYRRNKGSDERNITSIIIKKSPIHP